MSVIVVLNLHPKNNPIHTKTDRNCQRPELRARSIYYCRGAIGNWRARTHTHSGFVTPVFNRAACPNRYTKRQTANGCLTAGLISQQCGRWAFPPRLIAISVRRRSFGVTGPDSRGVDAVELRRPPPPRTGLLVPAPRVLSSASSDSIRSHPQRSRTSCKSTPRWWIVG